MTRHSLWIRDAEADVLREATHEEIIRAARSCLARRVVKGAVLQSPGATRDFILVELSERSHESFCVLYLDNRHRVLSWQEIFRGTIDGASVYPREVVKEAISRRAAACILVHIHQGLRSRARRMNSSREGSGKRWRLWTSGSSII
jgi:DNA repair protein RadC